MLRKILSSRIGNYCPFETHSYLFPKDNKILKDNPVVDAKVIDPEENNKNIQEYMFQTFYSEAPIPIALKLSRNCEETKDFLKKEVTLFTNGGVSMNLIESKTNEIKGIAFSVPWKKEDDYDIVNAKAKEWHNCAADIAHEFAEDKRHLIWRNLQFQHIYDLGQQVLSNSKKPFVVYLAMLYFDKEVRSSQISYKVMSSYRNSEECKECSFLVQSNFPGFDKTVHQALKKPKLVDEVKYSEEKLVMEENGGRAFSVIDKLDRLRFFVDY